MKISAISDVHVKVAHDSADQLLCQFLDHPLTKSSDYILLLGDIFDLMCGPHPQYLKEFKHIFDRFKVLTDSGRKIYFFEGNHDVHLEGLFKKLSLNENFIITSDPAVIKVGEKNYYFSHGDEHEVDNVSYQKYKNFIMSRPLKFVANHLLPYSVLNYIGRKASQKSRKKGSRVFDPEKVKIRFRNGVMSSTNGDYDLILGGHSHVKDDFVFGERNSRYLNNGYALNSKTFIHVSKHEAKFIELDN